jgi:AraC family transcriptional activator of pobA
MRAEIQIPIFNLFGETAHFPDVVHCERIRDRARMHDWVISPHRHRDMAQVLHMERGAAELRIDGQLHMLYDGDFVFIAPRVVHGFVFRRGSEGVVLSFPVHVLAGIEAVAPGLGQMLSAAGIGRATAEIEMLVGMIAVAFGGGGRFRPARLVALAQALWVAIGASQDRVDAASSPVSRRMQQFDALIEQNLGRGWGPAQYAQALAVTPGHLNRLCRAVTGSRTSDHIEKTVMAEACRLLAFTQLSVAEVGFRLGYDDPSYFTRRFHRAMGQTPTDYRSPFV